MFAAGRAPMDRFDSAPVLHDQLTACAFNYLSAQDFPPLVRIVDPVPNGTKLSCFSTVFTPVFLSLSSRFLVLLIMGLRACARLAGLLSATDTRAAPGRFFRPRLYNHPYDYSSIPTVPPPLCFRRKGTYTSIYSNFRLSGL